MRSPPNIIRSNRVWGGFFLFLALTSAGTSSFAFCAGDWTGATVLVFAIFFFSFLGWTALTSTAPYTPPRNGGSRGLSEAGKPVPVRPAPRHHLVAARDL